tara:strand:- start:418 stop:1425 length:1008 start_codon:yes stop_codon:yes gene_type:complete
MKNTGVSLTYPRSVEKTGYYLNFYSYDYNKAQSLGVKSIRDMLSGSISGSKLLNKDIKSNLPNATQNQIETSNNKDQTSDGVEWNRSSDDPSNSRNGCVRMYIPPSLEYKYSANWNKVSFGAAGAAFGDAGTALGAAGASATALAFDKIISKNINEAPKTENISADSLLGGAFGITFNDNTLQTFEKMNVREFGFDYLLAARNRDEEEDIKQIIKFFKLGMHPGSRRSGSNNSLFLEYPYIYRIVQSGKKDISQFLPNTKYCALTNVAVNYTPDNVLALTTNNFVQAVRLTLTFSELTTLTRQDIHEIEDTATPEEMNFIKDQKSKKNYNSEYSR